MEKGQITVFLSLIFTLLLSVICTAAEGVRGFCLELEGKIALEAAADSLLSEYDRDLLKEYDVFYVNGGSREGNFSSENIGQKLAEYINCNLDVSKGGKILAGGNLLQGSVNLVEAGNFTLATDGNGQDFFAQVVDYEEKRHGLDFVEALVAQAEEGKELFKVGEDVEEQKGEKEEEFIQLEEENKETESSFGEEDLGNSNPLTQMEDNKAQGIWRMIMKDHIISGKALDLSKLPSGRELLTGSGREEDVNLTEKVLFNEYILEKFNHALDEKRETGLSYEVEYILAGKDSDRANLEAVITKLLIFREGVNYLYLHSDSAKVSEADALATTLVGFTGLPPVILVVRELLLLSWAYGESILDLQNLMNGGTLALIKTGENWQLELENVGHLFNEEKDVRKETGGLDYEGYLRLLLGLAGRETLIMRTLDLLEINMRQKEGKEAFRIDCCFSSFQCNVTYEANTVFLTLPTATGMLKKTNGKYQFQMKEKASY